MMIQGTLKWDSISSVLSPCYHSNSQMCASISCVSSLSPIPALAPLTPCSCMTSKQWTIKGVLIDWITCQVSFFPTDCVLQRKMRQSFEFPRWTPELKSFINSIQIHSPGSTRHSSMYFTVAHFRVIKIPTHRLNAIWGIYGICSPYHSLCMTRDIYFKQSKCVFLGDHKWIMIPYLWILPRLCRYANPRRTPSQIAAISSSLNGRLCTSIMSDADPTQYSITSQAVCSLR